MNYSKLLFLGVMIPTLIFGAPTVYKYRIYCNTEAQNVYEWAETAPTTCPNNTSHSINMNSISIIDKIASNEVKIQSESVPTGGNFRTETFKISSTGAGVTTTQISWPFNVSLLLATCTCTPDNNGDKVTVEIPSDLTIGNITQDVSVNDTVINVSSSVTSNIAIGFYVSITDGANSDELGRVLAVNTINNTITVEAGSTNSYSAASPTLVAMTVRPIDNFEFGPVQTYNIGQSSLGASHIPANIPIVVKYTNNGSTPKTLIFNYEYLY